ncbi:MAG: hypothetical protein JWM96_80, partial [Alphaproteobacteria bacterium]|nr:hypothetical protein [Alphaproteobacteria bacterium]
QPALNDGEKEKGFDRLINLVGDPDQEVGKTATTSLDAAASYLVGFDRNILKAKVEFVQNLELTDDARDRVNKAYNIVTRKGPQ